MIVVDASFYVDVVVVENNIVLGCGLRVWAHRFYFVVSSPAACGLRLAACVAFDAYNCTAAARDIDLEFFTAWYYRSRTMHYR